MENVNIKSAGSEEDVSTSKQKFNLNDVLNGTVVLPFEDELGVLLQAIENIRDIHIDLVKCHKCGETENVEKGTLNFAAQTWMLIQQKVLNKIINLLTNEIEKTQDENKKIEYKILLKNFNETLESSEEYTNAIIRDFAKIMWFGIN